MFALFKNRKKEEQKEDNEKQELLVELKEASEAINAVYRNLAFIADKDMIDCCIYELNALQLRYKIILNQMREREAMACISIKKNEINDDI